MKEATRKSLFWSCKTCWTFKCCVSQRKETRPRLCSIAFWNSAVKKKQKTCFLGYPSPALTFWQKQRKNRSILFSIKVVSNVCEWNCAIMNTIKFYFLLVTKGRRKAWFLKISELVHKEYCLAPHLFSPFLFSSLFLFLSSNYT